MLTRQLSISYANASMKVTSIRNATSFKQTVLLIDDQPTVLDIHTAILKSLKMNLHIVTMTNPIEALAWMKNKQVDLVITDYRMRPMDGMSFVNAIKHENSFPNTSILVVSVIKDKKIQQDLIAAGAAACLAKPINPDELKKLAQSLLVKNKQLSNQTTEQ